MKRPSPWFERQATQQGRDERLMTWSQPTWIERNGEFIAALLGAAVFGFAVATLVIVALVGS